MNEWPCIHGGSVFHKQDGTSSKTTSLEENWGLCGPLLPACHPPTLSPLSSLNIPRGGLMEEDLYCLGRANED